MNNFKELQKQQEELYKQNVLGIKNKIDSNLNVLGIFTNIIEVFFSKLIDCFISLAGGQEKQD